MNAFAPASSFGRIAGFGRNFGPQWPAECGGCNSALRKNCDPASCQGRRSKNNASRKMAGLTLELITDRVAFDALEDEWNELHDYAGPFSNAFLSFNWCWHWCNHFLGEDTGTELHILTGRRFGRLVMVWPMVRQRAGGMTSLTWLGAPVSQYGDVLAGRGEGTLDLLEAGWEFLRSDLPVDFVALWKVRGDSNVAPLLKKLGFEVTQRESAPYVDLASAPTFDEYAKRYSSNRRKKQKQKLRHLNSLGTVDHLFEYEGADARDLSQRIIELKSRWLKDKGIVSSGLSDARTAAFFADVAEGLERPTGCRVMALMCGDDIAAGEISFASGDTVSGHIVVFNNDYTRQSPGMLLTEDNLRVCKDYGYSRYDFMGPTDQHKLDWADGSVEVNDYAAAVSMKGWLWVTGYLSWGRPRLKKLLNATPPGVRGFIAKLHPALTRLA